MIKNNNAVLRIIVKENLWLDSKNINYSILNYYLNYIKANLFLTG